MNPEKGTLGDWQLERFRLGELPEAERREVATALARDPGLRARLDALDRDDGEILAAHPPRETAAAIRARLARESRAPAAAPAVRPRASWALARPRPLVAAAGAAVVGVLLLAPAIRAPRRDERPLVLAGARDATRIKGAGPRLLLYRQVRAAAEPLADGARVRARDVIQVLYVAAGQRYGVVVSLDGRGVQSLHLPTGGRSAAELAPGGPVVLASAWELDDAPGFERFFFVTSTAPFTVETVTAALGQAAAAGGDPARLPLPTGLVQSTFLLRKDGSR